MLVFNKRLLTHPPTQSTAVPPPDRNPGLALSYNPNRKVTWSGLPPKSSWFFVVPVPDLSTDFCENWSSSFCVILLTNKLTPMITLPPLHGCRGSNWILLHACIRKLWLTEFWVYERLVKSFIQSLFLELFCCGTDCTSYGGVDIAITLSRRCTCVGVWVCRPTILAW